jgi:tetratricopeptide (TPR) repeat protein
MTFTAIPALIACLGLDPAAVETTAKPKAAPTQSAGQDADGLLAKIRELHRERRWKELTDQFATQDFSAWPENSAQAAAEALRLRGQAYAALKNGKQAEADLKASLKFDSKHVLTWHALAENYSRNLADDREALAAYRQVVAITGRTNGWLPISSTLEIARILTDQVETDEALRVLETYGDAPDMAPVWRIRLLRIYGHVYASKGDERASLAKFREALELETSTR